MFIYNVTCQVSHNIHTDWLHWMKKEHIPAVIDCGCFTSYQIVRILEIDEEHGPTYAIQYQAATKNDYDRYMSEFAPIMRKDVVDNWGDNVTIFRTLMQVVN